jgi:glutamine amidotransferase
MTTNIAIIDYGAGNLFSVQAAFERLVSCAEAEIFITDDAARLRDASHIVLPGVGAFADCLHALQHCNGMIAALERAVFTHSIPFLGICVGMQLLCEKGYEGGTHSGLGWIEGDIVPLTPDPEQSIRIPHMGWNSLSIHQPHPLLENISIGDDVYFVHSYHAQLTHAHHAIATTHYGQSIVAALAKDNIMGTQFHPEKSHRTGEAILANFVKMR